MIRIAFLTIILTSAVSCWFSPSHLANNTDNLEALEQVLSGPLSSRNLVLYIDDQLQRDVLLLPSIKSSPHITVNLESNGLNWSEQQPSSLLQGPYYIHVVFFQDVPPETFFQAVSQRWNPSHLLLCSLLHGRIEVLEIQAFQRIQWLTLVMPDMSNSGEGTLSFSAYTIFPFSGNIYPRPIKHWRSGSPPLSFGDVFIDRFPSFDGYEFHLSTYLDDYPFLYESEWTAGQSLLKPSPNRPIHEGDGVAIELLDAMSGHLNYTYTVTLVSPDEMWGVFLNGSWHGMLGAVHREEKNFTTNHLPLTIQRMESFDASVPYWIEGYGMSIRTPPPLPKWPGVSYPFMPTVWLCVIVTFSIIVLSMAIQDCLQPEPFLGGFEATWLYLMQSVINHSLPTLPKAPWQRVFMGSWLLYCFIITIAYTANLIAFLTIPVYPKRIQTVKELAESEFRLARDDYGDFIPDALRNSDDPYYRALGEKLDLDQDGDIVAGYMLSGTHAYIENFSYNKIFFIYHYKTDSYMVQEEVFPGSLCWYFQKNTAWKYKFDLGLQRLFQSGLISYWMKVKSDDFLGRDFDRQQILQSRETSPQPLVLEHLQGPFFILLISWMTGFLTFILEILKRNAKCFPEGKCLFLSGL